MMEVASGDGPILSICIPTYNRAASLRNLCRNLQSIKLRFGSRVDICVSNNGSTDDTTTVLEEYQENLGLRIVTQPRNIGGTLNIIAVAQMSRGRWGIFLGDDDELVPDAFGELLAYLEDINPDGWVLVDAADLTGRAQYMNLFAEQRYRPGEFKWQILRSGLNRFSFMGVHVFPRSAIPTFNELTLDESRPWPFIAALLRVMMKGHSSIHVLKKTITLQARGGAKLFWSGGDMARIRLAKLQILRFARKTRPWAVFYWALLFRELYSVSSYKSLLAWKLYEGADFQRHAPKTYLRAYASFGVLLPLVFAHAIPMLCLRLCPNRVYVGLFRLIGKHSLLEQYQQLKRELGEFDGIKRGI